MSTDRTNAATENEAEPHDSGHGSFSVVIRTPAGFSKEFHVTESTKTAALTNKAIHQFQAVGQLGEGNYRLVLLRDGNPIDLVASGRLADAGVRSGDQLALVTTDPQVDG